MYSQDFEETLPWWTTYYVCTTYSKLPDAQCGLIAPNYWDVVLQPYVKSGNPGVTTSPDRFGGAWNCPNNEVGDTTKRSYGISIGLVYSSFVPAPVGGNYYRALPIASIEAPASTVFVGEGDSVDGRIGRPIDMQGYDETYISKVGKRQGSLESLHGVIKTELIMYGVMGMPST